MEPSIRATSCSWVIAEARSGWAKIVPFAECGEERDPPSRLRVVFPAGIVVTVLSLIVFALVASVATHIG